jgi:hypothetical protein
MQKTVLTIVALGLFGASAARAAEPSLFAVFKAACFDTHADPQKALAALGPGWSDAPAQVAGAVHKTRQVGAERWDVQLLEMTEAEGERGAPFAMRMRMCTASTSSVATDVKAAQHGLMGVAPTDHSATGPVWSFFDEPGGRRFVTDKDAAAMNGLVAKHPLRIVMSNDGPATRGAGFTEMSRAGK